jgi:hypothetical protein
MGWEQILLRRKANKLVPTNADGVRRSRKWWARIVQRTKGTKPPCRFQGGTLTILRSHGHLSTADGDRSHRSLRVESRCVVRPLDQRGLEASLGDQGRHYCAADHRSHQDRVLLLVHDVVGQPVQRRKCRRTTRGSISATARKVSRMAPKPARKLTHGASAKHRCLPNPSGHFHASHRALVRQRLPAAADRSAFLQRGCLIGTGSTGLVAIRDPMLPPRVRPPVGMP